MAYAGVSKVKPMTPNSSVKSTSTKKAPSLGAAVTPKAVLGKATKPNLKNMGKSIKPTVRSTPYGKE